jgi:hypothetical protein
VVGLTKVLIDTDAVRESAKHVAAVQNGFGNAWTSLSQALTAVPGMAGAPGRDQAAAKFVAVYEPAVQAVWRGFATLHRSVGDMSRGLDRTAVNHLNADRRSVIDRRHSPAPRSTVPFRDRLLGFVVSGPLNLPAPPSSAGSGKPAPRSLLERLFGIDSSGYWPTGYKERLAEAGAAWREAGSSLRELRGRLAAEVKSVGEHSDAPDIEAFSGYWSILYRGGASTTLLEGLPRLCDGLAKICWEYSAALLEAETKLNDAAGNPVAALLEVATLRAALAAIARELLQSVSSSAAGALGGHIVSDVSLGASRVPPIHILEAAAEDGDFDEVLREWEDPTAEPDPDDLKKNVKTIAKKLHRTPEEIDQAIHAVKGEASWRGLGSNKNPDVVVNIKTGEVYPQSPDGIGESSLGNIFDHLRDLE